MPSAFLMCAGGFVCGRIVNACGCVVGDFNVCRRVLIGLNACWRVLSDI